MSITKIEHVKLAISRLITQFTEAPVLQGYIAALLSEADTLEEVICDVIEQRTIDNATGATLDVIGTLVGQSRVLIDSTLLTFFGYSGALGADTYADINDASIGSRYISLGETLTGNRQLTDDEYRLFIRARIAKNNSRGTIDSVAELSAFLAGVDFVVVTDGESPAAFSLGFSAILSKNIKIFLKNSDLIPKPAGVRINYLYEFPADKPFGFVGAAPNVGGYDEGTYASIF
jgi:hypothetical protein